MEFIATAAFGLEGLVKQELKHLGVDASGSQGGARFSGTTKTAFMANLWLSSADRVLLVLREGEAKTFDALFQLVNSIPWEEYLPRDAAFPVSGNCVRSQLMSVSDCQRIAKKAIVERLKGVYHTEWFQETGAKYPVSVTLHNDIARVTLDTSGDALNRRGYRTWTGEAPLRETLAAAMVRLCPWETGHPLHDPCCGTGTLLIEAAFLAARRAPGLTRHFAMENWPLTDRAACDLLRREAENLYQPEKIKHISGSDIDPEALTLARRHIRQAGLEGKITVYQKDVRDLKLDGPAPCFITNPPYGERLGDKPKAQKIAAALGNLLSMHPGSVLCALSADPAFERFVKRKPSFKRRLYNGRLECELIVMQG